MNIRGKGTPRRRLAAVAVVTLAAATPLAAKAHQSATPQDVAVPPAQRIIDSQDLTAGCGATPAGRVRVDGRDDEWRAEPTMIAGTGRYAGGEYVWTDYPFDDDGTGSFQYPGEGEPLVASEGGPGTASPRGQRYGANAADVVEVRASADDAFVHLLVRLNFLNAVDSTAVGFAIDVDDDPTTGAGTWPRGAAVATPGADLFVTAFGSCAYVQDASGEVALDSIGGAAAVGTDANVMELALPRSLFGDGDVVRIAAGAGLWDPAAGAWMVPTVGTRPGRAGNANDRPAGAVTPRDPAIFNLLFRGDETTVVSPADRGSPRTFQTDRQNDTLLSGSTGGYVLDLDLARLGDGATGDDPMPLRRGDEGDFVRLYRSRMDAEGVVVGGSGGNFALYLSRYQPYAINVPACYEAGDCPWPAGRAPAVLGLHGGSGSHLEAGPEASIAEGGTNLYGQESTYRALEAEVAPVVIRTLGRGQRPPWHRGYGEIDELEALADATARYDLDPDRRMIMGGSLGGYGTLRLASLYPELFSGAFAHCPASYENGTSARFVGHVDPSGQHFTVQPIMPNLLHVPVRQASGTLDPLVPITTNHRLRDAALAAELDFGYTEYLAGGHCWDNAEGGVYPWIANHVAEMVELLSRPRETRPARVRYFVDPRQFFAGPETIGVSDIRDLGIDYDGAYWISGLDLRDEVVMAAAAAGAGEDVVGGVDVISRGRPGWQLSTESCGDSTGLGGELGGNPSLRPRVPTPHTYECQAQIRGGDLANELDLTALNTRAVTVDLAAAGLDGRSPLLVRASGDGPLTLTLTGMTGGNVDGTCVTRLDRHPNTASLHLELTDEPCTIGIRGAVGDTAGGSPPPPPPAPTPEDGAGGCPWTEFTRLPGASAFPDTNTQVFQCVYSAGPAHETVITGEPPAARFWSFALVDQARREIDNISDDEIQLNADGRYRIVVRTDCRDATNCIETAGGPVPTAPGLVYYRLYVPEEQYGGVGLPEVRYLAPGTTGGAAIPHAELLADHEYALTDPIAPGGEGYEALARHSGFERSVDEPTAADPQPERFRGTGAAQVDDLEAAGAPAPVVGAARTVLGEGGFGGTRDNAYLTVPYDMRQGNVVLRAKAPTYRGSGGSAANDLGRTDRSEQVRFWSLCTTQATRSVDCIRDEQVTLDADGYFDVILSPVCPVSGHLVCLRTGVTSGVGRGTLLYRNTLPEDSFYNDLGPAVCPETAPSMFCGDYALIARYVARPS